VRGICASRGAWLLDADWRAAARSAHDRNFGLLSFGEEAHEEEELVTKTISSGAMKMKGSYVLETDEEVRRSVAPLE